MSFLEGVFCYNHLPEVVLKGLYLLSHITLVAELTANFITARMSITRCGYDFKVGIMPMFIVYYVINHPDAGYRRFIILDHSSSQRLLDLWVVSQHDDNVRRRGLDLPYWTGSRVRRRRWSLISPLGGRRGDNRGKQRLKGRAGLARRCRGTFITGDISLVYGTIGYTMCLFSRGVDGGY